jgi:AcrR family transcriptional regulator
MIYYYENGAKMISRSKAAVGRPSRVTAQRIAETALVLGLERATVRSVADAMGVSVPGLYHHVRTREELLAMASEYAFKAIPANLRPNMTVGQWLLEYAQDLFNSLRQHPEMINQIALGNSISAGMTVHLEWVCEALGKFGFSVIEAYETFAQIMTAVIGAAALDAGDRAMAGAGGGAVELRIKACAYGLPIEETRRVRELTRSGRAPSVDRFDGVRMIIGSIVERHRSKSRHTSKSRSHLKTEGSSAD